jgi:hypothetical protein
MTGDYPIVMKNALFRVSAKMSLSDINIINSKGNSHENYRYSYRYFGYNYCFCY